MRLRLHEAGHAVVGYRFGYTQQGIMLREDDTGETSQQYATGMDDDMSVRLQTETIISMAGFAVTLEYPEYRTDALRIGGDVQSELVNAATIHRIDPARTSSESSTNAKRSWTIEHSGMAGRPDRLSAAARMGRTARRLAWVASAHRSPHPVPLREQRLAT